jgi:hypothetical protein
MCKNLEGIGCGLVDVLYKILTLWIAKTTEKKGRGSHCPRRDLNRVPLEYLQANIRQDLLLLLLYNRVLWRACGSNEVELRAE